MQMLSPSGSSLPMPPQAQILPPVEFHNTKAGTVARRNSEPGKGKASTRAKSGCWTCRIRRKKCDEMKTPEGFCQTCVRLRLECLGWGSRRPDWMREKNNVIERRERIKEFLANNGMIKGHAGSISRTPADTVPDILNLAFTGNSPPRHPGDHSSNPTQAKHNPHQHPHSVMLPPVLDRDRRGPLMDFAHVASDPHQYGQLHQATYQYHHQQVAAAHQAMVAGRHHHLDGPMLPPLSMPTPIENGMRTHHLPPPPDGSGLIQAIDPALQYLADFGPPSASATDGTSSQATATTATTTDSTGRPVVSLPTPSQCKSPSPSCTSTSG